MYAYLSDFKFPKLARNSFALFIRNFFALTGALVVAALAITLLFGVPTFFAVVNSQATDVPTWFIVTLYLFIACIVSIPGYMLVVETSELCLGGRTSFRHALGVLSGAGIARYLLSTSLQLLIVAGPFLAAACLNAVCDRLAPAASSLLAIPLIVAAAVLASWLFVRLQFVTQAAVLEKRGMLGSVRRSWELSHRYAPRIFFYQVGFAALVVVAVLAALLLLTPAILFVPDDPASPVYIALVVVALLYEVFAVIALAALPLIFHTLMYYCIRVAKHNLSMDDIVDMQAYGPVQ